MRWPWQKQPQPSLQDILADQLRHHRAMNPTRRDLEDMELAWVAGLSTDERREIRCAMGWTQDDVAARCGVKTVGQVGKWERSGAGWSRRTGLLYAALLRELVTERAEV